MFQTKSLFVHRKFGVLPRHASNKSVICGCGSFCKIHGQVVSIGMHRPKSARSFLTLANKRKCSNLGLVAFYLAQVVVGSKIRALLFLKPSNT